MTKKTMKSKNKVLNKRDLLNIKTDSNQLNSYYNDIENQNKLDISRGISIIIFLDPANDAFIYDDINKDY